MLAITRGDQRCFLWFRTVDSEDCVIREWAIIGGHGTTRAFTRVADAVEHLKTTIPAVADTEEFERLRKAFLHGKGDQT